ncbi:MAG: CHAP domain-containing protein [Gordonia sp. (in: high G+C Gram-positive bacteria)]
MVAAAAVLIVAAVVGVYVLGDDDRPAFPATDAAALDPVRARILDVARDEYDANAPGTAYSAGVTEPWCADFATTVLHKAGVPLVNPNSGSWRIPGVATLGEALRAAGRWRPASYRPTPGDLVLYDVPSPLGQHTNIVVAVADGRLTTVGGNEDGGITLRTVGVGTDPGITGYGVPGS